MLLLRDSPEDQEMGRVLGAVTNWFITDSDKIMERRDKTLPPSEQITQETKPSHKGT
jgi:hypothetical protein